MKFFLLVTILILVLLLTGALGPILFASLQVIGWVLVVILLGVLVVVLFSPITGRLKKHQAVRDLKQGIKTYDTNELEGQLEEATKRIDPIVEAEKKRRKELGYDE